MEWLGLRRTIFERPEEWPTGVDRRLAQTTFDEGKQLRLGWEILEDSMCGAIVELPRLIGVARRVELGNGRRAAFDEPIV